MATSDQLRENKEQHKPKNTDSIIDDRLASDAMERTIRYINERFPDLERDGYYIDYQQTVLLADLVAVIKGYEKRVEYATLNNKDAFMSPDGGLLILKKKSDKTYQRLVLVVEMKRQGTNDRREKEGKKKQAQGNAVERLGKNLIGIRSTLQYENITPFVCFGWGVDFVEGSSILDRIITMNEFYDLNKIYVFKKDGYSPVSMFFRKEQWSVEELFEVMKEIAETSIRNYIH
ncbi:MAG: restriction endonuclease [Candidatus Kaiserbacteria bacterium]|nr:restriction endonuclease [Candidatus Kaiserbacteria bacterium]